MSGTIIKSARNTANAPQDLSPSTQSVAFSHYNNISAQLPVDPKTGALVAGDIKAQARQCLTNIKAIVESIDHVMDDVVKITVFLKEIADLDAVNAVYGEFFPNCCRPAPCWRWPVCRSAPPCRWTRSFPTAKAPSRRPPARC